MDQLVDILSEQFHRGIAKHVQSGPICERAAALNVQPIDRFSRCIQEESQVLSGYQFRLAAISRHEGIRCGVTRFPANRLALRRVDNRSPGGRQ